MAEVMLPLIVRRSRWGSAVSLLLSLMILGGSIWIHVERDVGWLAWTLIVISGVCCLYFSGRTLDSEPRLTISELGICAEHWSLGTIPWREFSETFVKSDGGIDHVCLTLRNPERYRGQMNRMVRTANTATRQTGFGDLTIKPSDLGLATRVVSELVRKQIGAIPEQAMS
jgi:hypothetical protein